MAHHADSPRILLVKTTSLGDVLHNLPVISDIVRHYPGAQIDWMVEEGFAALPRLHPAVRNVIPVAVRRWRKQLFSAKTWREIGAFRKTLSAQQYDFAIDTQGLFKSALLMRGANGLRCGMDKTSAREPLAASMYQRTFTVAKGQHAVERNRQLVAQALGYALDGPAEFGIRLPLIPSPDWLPQGNYVALLHATSRADKLWDEASWVALGHALHEKNIRCVLPWGSEAEKARSLRLTAQIPDAISPPRLNLDQAATLLGKAHAVIGVDTGLAHLAAALNVPTAGIYTATDPTLTGLYRGPRTINLGNIGQPPNVAAVLGALRGMGAC
ncbi:MAG: lipopolysaccharide heptosyltransferase I [Nitrosomonadales bacterium]|nr:lipopolysaccharide heptosyltransferase I [Nitrosomonadales bacterium]